MATPICGAMTSEDSVVISSVWPSGSAFRHRVGADPAGGAGAVLDVERLAEELLQVRLQHARDQVGAAAGRKRHHDPHRPALANAATGEQVRRQPRHARRDRKAGMWCSKMLCY